MKPIVTFVGFVLLTMVESSAEAKLKVITTTTDLGFLVHEVGGAEVEVETLSKGTQDPHHLEAKPSYMVKANRADLAVAVGLGLEAGWLPNILRGARNPKLRSGEPGFLEIGPRLNPIEKEEGTVTRAQGDVHPEGNPHVTLDPERAGHAAMLIAERLFQLDRPNEKKYLERGKSLQNRLNSKMKGWKERIEKSGIQKVVTYHRTLNYFLDRFGIRNIGNLEPKPGIPPTASHVLNLSRKIKDEKVKLILIENFYDKKVAERVTKEIPDLRIENVPVAVGGSSEIKTLDDLYEKLIATIEGQKP